VSPLCQQIEPAGGIIDAHREVERRVKVMRRVQLFDRDRTKIMPLRPAAINRRMVHANRWLEAEVDLLPLQETLHVRERRIAHTVICGDASTHYRCCENVVDRHWSVRLGARPQAQPEAISTCAFSRRPLATTRPGAGIPDYFHECAQTFSAARAESAIFAGDFETRDG
jgi:hypothetical protein